MLFRTVRYEENLEDVNICNKQKTSLTVHLQGAD